MSWRISLDHYREGNDFNVPAEGTMDVAVKEYAFQRPLKLYFVHRSALHDWWDACMRVFDFCEANGPSAFYQRTEDGYEDVTPDHELTAEDYGVVLDTEMLQPHNEAAE